MFVTLKHTTLFSKFLNYVKARMHKGENRTKQVHFKEQKKYFVF